MHLLRNTVFSVGVVWLIGGCGLQKMLPEHPVMTPWSWSETFAAPMFSGAKYEGEPLVPFPVLPVQVWGVAYELDLVLVSQNPKYDMHEFASLRTDEGLIWIAKDAAAGSLEQTIVTNLPNPEEWFPEIPVRRSSGPLTVQGVAESDQVKMSFKYTTLAGDHIEARYEGKAPSVALKKRNGSTMGHSRDALMAVLDLSHRNFGKKASLQYNGVPGKMKRLLGLVPFQMALQQTQGGLATTRLRQEKPMAEDAQMDISQSDFVTYYTLPGEHLVSRSWEVLHRREEIVATQHSAYRTLKYAWRVVDGNYELHEASVQQPGRESNVTTVRFQPALPDMRRRFSGVVESRFGVAINGQPGLAMGRVQAFWKEDKAVVRVIPESPWWVADRPMESHLQFSEEGVQLQVERIVLP